MTNRRFRNDISIIQFSMAALPFSPTGLLFLAVRSPLAEIVLQQFRAERPSSFGRDQFSRQESGDDFGILSVLGADAHLSYVEDLGSRAFLQEVLVPNEYDEAVAFIVHCFVGDDDGILFFAKDDLALAKGIGPQRTGPIVDIRPNLHGA